MRGFSKIFSFTFTRQIKSRAYQIVTLLGILILFLVPFILLPVIEKDAGESEEIPEVSAHDASGTPSEYAPSDIKTVFFVNQTQSYKGDFTSALSAFLKDSDYRGAQVVQQSSYEEALLAASKDAYSLILLLEELPVSDSYSLSTVYPDNSKLAYDHAIDFEDWIGGYGENLEIAGYGLPFALADDVNINPSAASEDDGLAGSGQTAENPATDSQTVNDEEIEFIWEIIGFVLPYVNIMLIYFLVLYYGQGVAQNCIIEKSSKLMDTFLVSVKPKAMLLGKVLGCAFSAIFQFTLWMVALILGFVLGLGRAYAIHPTPLSAPILLIKNLRLGDLNLPLFRILIACLLIFAGFLLYSSIAAIGGSLASKQEELGTTNIIFTTFLIISFFICLSKGFLQADQMPSMGILDFIPFTSLMITPARVVMGVVPIPYALLSLAILLITSLLILAFAGKLYKLLTFYKGNIPKPREIWKLMTEKN